MQSETENKKNYNNEDVIDLVQLLEDYLHCAKKFWLPFLLVIALTAAGAMGYQKYVYEPAYVAKITYAVTTTGDTTIDAALAQRISASLPTLEKATEFREELFSQMDPDSINDNYTISASYTENANFFSVQISADDYEIANLLLEEFENIYPSWVSRTNGSASLEIVDISEAGSTPSNAYSKFRTLFMGIFGGLLLCAAFSTVYSLTRKTVRKESDMKKITNAGCITILPDIKGKARDRSTKNQFLITNKRIDWGFKQSILSAQSRIEKMLERQEGKVLMVSSTVPQEGKSLTTVNLALAFAQSHKNVLVIDGDLRNPSILKMVGSDGQHHAGLSDYFRAKIQPDDIIVHTKKLDIIPGGTSQGALSTFFIDSRMEKLIRILRERYDYILIDTPPSHLFSDAQILSRYADGVVYVVRHDTADLTAIKDGIAGFIKSQKLLGYMINRNPGGFSSYGKYGYGKYGYGRYGKYDSKYKHYIQETEESLNTEDTL